MSKAGAAAVALGMVLIIPACAATDQRWEHPAKPQSAWAQDEADCRQRAASTAERRFGIRQETRISMDAPMDGRSSSRFVTMDSFESQRYQTRLFERCMTQKGFVQVAVDPPEEAP